MNNVQPLDFCLLIPCYNNSEGLMRSLASLQYPKDKYLVVLVDDGSAEPVFFDTQSLTSSIQIIRLPQNRGITVALNVGLEWICKNTTTRYIARLDCGDICTPNRFFKQVFFLDANPGVGLLGSWCFFKDYETGTGYCYKAPAEDKAIRRAMHFRNAFIHPTVMFRADLLKQAGFYPEDFPYAEDYAFFWKLLQYAQGAILPDSLVTCAVSPMGISVSNRQKQLESCRRIISAFGTQPFLKQRGIYKTRLRQFIPQKLIFLAKRLLSS